MSPLKKIVIPEDFMFVLNEEEFTNLMSQNATSSWGGRKKLPRVFTQMNRVIVSDEVIMNKFEVTICDLKGRMRMNTLYVFRSTEQHQPRTEIGFKRKGK